MRSPVSNLAPHPPNLGDPPDPPDGRVPVVGASASALANSGTVRTALRTASRDSEATTAGRDLVALVALTLALRVPALLASRHLVFDDGVYGASALAMRDGALPFRDVFSSQGPLFLPLVWLADVAGFRTLDAPRLLSLVSGAVLVGATWRAGRALELPRAAAVGAATLVATSGSVMWVSGPVTSDAPALALATTAVTLALVYRHHPSLRLAAGAGLALGAALSVKSLLVPAVVPVSLALVAGRRSAGGSSLRWRSLAHLVAAGATAAAFGLLVALPWGLADVWDQAFAYHLEVAGPRTPGANAAKIAATLADRDLPLLVVAGAALAGAGRLFRRARSARPAVPRRSPAGDGVRLLAIWLTATVAVLLLEHPLWRSHVAHLVPAVALLSTTAVGRVRHRVSAGAGAAAVVVVALVLPAHLARNRTILLPGPPSGPEAAARADLATLPPGSWAISDEPGLVWREGRRTPADLVDTSVLRIDTGRITAASVAAEATDARVCAVLVWSPRFARLATLPTLLASQGFTEAARYGGPRVLYRRDSCPA